MNLKPNDIAGHYTRMQIETASRPKQISMLHNRCVGLIKLATREKVSTQKRILLDKAQNILVQFQSALRMEDEISNGLFYLYDYSYLLLENGSEDSCGNAIDIMTELRETFNKLLLKL
ncbi:MAG: flagellar protein FliS [Chitinispirillia bacterium]|jgi:flagellin-specific chaperone FliS